tara:strand:+ start:52 stop:549 length:498 start_codon:yes stop_codon:yes gene_type:complete
MKKIFLNLIFAVVSFLIIATTPHPYHVSSAELFLSTKTNEWNLNKKVFTEDIEKALSAMNDENIKLDLINEENQAVLEHYVNSKIQIFKINGKLIDYKILQYTYSPESINIELKFRCSKKFKILDEFLFDIFKDHKNVYAIRKDPEKGFSQHEVTRVNSTIFTVL